MSTPLSPRFLRGSLITLRRRCGKPGCRCAGKDGQPHESPALSCTINGKSHVITLASNDITVVVAALRAYHVEQERLEEACSAGIAWLRNRVQARRYKRTGQR
jgi:hypothetical protein